MYLKSKQGGVCAICGKPIEMGKQQGNKTDYVVDHDHNTGEIRGVLHRSCNSAEGKVTHAAGSWGAGGLAYEKVIPWLKAMIAYLEKPGTGFMYPSHKTPEEKHAAELQKRRVQRAAKKARAKVKEDANG